MRLLFDLACKLELRLLVCRDGAGALLLASDSPIHLGRSCRWLGVYGSRLMTDPPDLFICR